MADWVDEPDSGTCQIEGCDAPAAVRLDVPWAGLRDVCAAHGRTWVQREGVVGMPIEEAEESWSQGQATDRE